MKYQFLCSKIKISKPFSTEMYSQYLFLHIRLDCFEINMLSKVNTLKAFYEELFSCIHS